MTQMLSAVDVPVNVTDTDAVNSTANDTLSDANDADAHLSMWSQDQSS